MPETVSYFDITEFYWAVDAAKNGAIIQSGTNAWKPLVEGFDRVLMKHREERYQSRGNLQTLSIDQQVKKWLEFEYSQTALKYDSASPALSYWDFIAQAFYGGATGAPATRPGSVQLGLKINRSTPEFYTVADAIINSVQLKGSFVKDAMMILYKGMGRLYRLDTNNYVQGTATKRAAAPKIPIVPSNDCLIKYDGNDITSLIDEFTLTMERKIVPLGRADTVSGTTSQIAVDGLAYREFAFDTFDARLDLVLDPYGTNTQSLIDHINDKSLGVCELRAEKGTGGKQIQFTASKINDSDQPHQQGNTPSKISLGIVGSTFNVNTL